MVVKILAPSFLSYLKCSTFIALVILAPHAGMFQNKSLAVPRWEAYSPLGRNLVSNRSSYSRSWRASSRTNKISTFFCRSGIGPSLETLKCNPEVKMKEHVWLFRRPHYHLMKLPAEQCAETLVWAEEALVSLQSH
jgi:hypothetical protein